MFDIGYFINLLDKFNAKTCELVSPKHNPWYKEKGYCTLPSKYCKYCKPIDEDSKALLETKYIRDLPPEKYTCNKQTDILISKSILNPA